VNVSKSASVKLFENERREFAEPLHSLVVAEWEADVINLPATIDAPWVWNEKYARDRQCLGSDVEKRTIGLFPHGMKLCLDEYLWPFPDRPAKNTLTTSRRSLTLNNREAVISGGTRLWPARNINGSSVRNDTAAEPQNVGLYEFWRTHED
jgi:hypothetical protein